MPIQANGSNYCSDNVKRFRRLKEAHSSQPIAKTPVIVITILMTINKFSMKYITAPKLSEVRKQQKSKAVSHINILYTP
ncbi:MAG: hypothetical protein QF907_00845 [Nitrospinota bacterium]|mgnify:FL=1|jgi:hypothetical protein|nr:hypothetical protein [Nitrospinota bacterium]MDP7349518.1 hypothetical protein [Nitrospinota bacterium]MDP7581001.1 hypothetical protein [Nitrospinota bacterium]